MALTSLFRRGRDGDAQPAESAPRAPRRAAPPVAELRRERRALLKLREERLRDVGGLAMEMFRRDSFREHVLHEQCAEVAAIEDRLIELETLLSVRRPPAARCACGAPLFWGSRFCASCGRPAGEAVVPCGVCGHALAADARYCPSCGAAAPEG
ncbi:MAG TPA: zinc ribbon domain-containing protein [Gaiellaceae bacterium]|nr:zinc ribbon domain-containing protein [Gaiellaceae bacterium]